jgi:signal transduction histidine kinase
MKLRPAFPPGTVHAARVALAASLLIGIVYAGCATVLDRAVAARLVAAVDARLAERLADVRETGLAAAAPGRDDDDDADQPPLYLWRLNLGRPAVALSAGAPRLPLATVRGLRSARTAGLRPGTFRLDSTRYHGALLVAGQSLAEMDHIEAMLGVGEALAAPVLLLAVFAGSLVIGWRALSPVEQSRQRQLEFTADASHELRAPLTVITAETSVALAARRTATEYRSALTRIEGESDRLRRIVEDLLWLARFDSQPPPPGAEPLDVATIAAGCADRFRPVARSQSTHIRLAGDGEDSVWIRAPHEWIDRLAGVLVDNACRHAGPDGTVLISVSQRASRVSLTVEDSGPGIAPEERDRLFDRFHRAVGEPGGAGLGLAIADSIVRSTSGQWRIGDSPLGGALFSVSWRRAGVERAPIRLLPDPDGAVCDPAGRPAGS